jgi:uncharacterized membrane protein
MSRSEVRTVTVLVCLFACGYALFGVFQHWSFGTSYDLGIFDQAIWHLSRFESFASSISGFSNLLGDHFYPILGLFAPLYWIAPAPEKLIVVQALLLASSIVPVFLFLRSRLPHGPVALCSAYGFFWGLQQTATSDFHEMALAPLLVATAILAMDRRNWTLLWTVCVLLMLVKEDLILSQRQQIYILEPTAPAPETEFIVASPDVSPWPYETYDEITTVLDNRRLAGYREAFEERGWIVLRRNSPL